MRLLPSGSRGVLVELDDLPQVMDLHARLRHAALPGVVDLVPAARTVLLVLDPRTTTAAAVADGVRAVAGRGTVEAVVPAPEPSEVPELVEVPVVYDGQDLAEVGRLTGWGADGVVARHTGTTWTVAFGGFAPGFGYAVADSGPTWQVPRRHEPRPRVPTGSVAVADGWTGVYPTASPGGWQLLGRTTATVWDLDRDPPALLRPGVRVRFVAT
ncbi:5-oxoprolinase subunit B family protein [Aquipuribacter sp. MA13-6]|uniref:5-oxoprolinase subunit B family protein n=1 Tax=unclassified Aquipuribacter TaxID=2635084 RepID=UPI003EEF0D0E